MKRMLKKLASPLTWIKNRPWPMWLYNMRSFPRDVKLGIRNLIIWLPIIWRDRDWDWQFLSEIMQFKLRNMSRFFRALGCTEDSEDRAEEMMEVWGHLRALEDDLPPAKLNGLPNTQEDYVAWEKKLKDHQTKAFYIMGTRMRYWWD